MKLGAYDVGKTLLYVASRQNSGAIWGHKVVSSNRRLSVSSSGVKIWRPFSGEFCPVLVVTREGDKVTLGIDGAHLEEAP